jgi:hypothetical protein
MLTARDFGARSQRVRREGFDHACPDCGRFAFSSSDGTYMILHRPTCPGSAETALTVGLPHDAAM